MGKWEMVRLGDVCEYEQPTKYIVETTDYNDAYDTPVLTAGQSFVLGYTNETNNIYTELPVIIFDDFTTASKYVDFPFKVKSSAMKILKPTEKANIKYLFYYMSTIKADTQLHKRYWISKYANIEIPLPPLSEQSQIVDVLDRASVLIEKRKAQLEKLDLLIKSQFIEMFGDPVTNPKRWRIQNLKDICTKLTDGTHFSPESYQSGDYMYITAKNIKLGGFDFSNITYVDSDVHDQIYARCNPEYGDVLYIKDGVTTGIAIVNTLQEPFTMLSSVALLKQNRALVTGEYLCGVLNNKKMYLAIRNNMGGAAITRLTITKLNCIKLPVPPISLQKQFAGFVRQVEAQKSLLRQSLVKLEQNYKSLMQKCFRGEIF